MSAVAGVGWASIVLALVATFGGFGCLCNVASHRCGGDEDFPTVREPDPTDSDAGDLDASDSGG